MITPIANLFQYFGCIIQINTSPDKLPPFTPSRYKGTSSKFCFFLILNTKNATVTHSFSPSSSFSPGTKSKLWQPRLLSSITSRDAFPTAQGSASGCCGTKKRLGDRRATAALGAGISAALLSSRPAPPLRDRDTKLRSL